MIPNCEGCKTELKMAYEEQEKGHYLATGINTNSYPINKGKHFFIIMVDEKGKRMIW